MHLLQAPSSRWDNLLISFLAASGGCLGTSWRLLVCSPKPLQSWQAGLTATCTSPLCLSMCSYAHRWCAVRALHKPPPCFPHHQLPVFPGAVQHSQVFEIKTQSQVMKNNWHVVAKAHKAALVSAVRGCITVSQAAFTGVLLWCILLRWVKLWVPLWCVPLRRILLWSATTVPTSASPMLGPALVGHVVAASAMAVPATAGPVVSAAMAGPTKVGPATGWGGPTMVCPATEGPNIVGPATVSPTTLWMCDQICDGAWYVSKTAPCSSGKQII